MSRRTHYIPVGNLVLDGVSIDPEIYCPANGFIDPLAPEAPTVLQDYPDTLGPACVLFGYEEVPTGEWIPPAEIPEATTEEIVLLVTNQSPYKIAFTVLTSSGSANVKMYDSLGVEYHSYTGNYFSYSFPSGLALAYYTIRITPATLGSNIRQFQRLITSGESYAFQILAAKFNTPNLTTMIQAFDGVAPLKSVEFVSTLDNVTTFANAFSGSGLTKFIFPAALPSVTSISNILKDCLDIIEVDYNYCTMPLLTNASGAHQGCMNLLTIKSTSTFSAITSLASFARDCVRLRTIVFNWSISNPVNISYLFYNCQTIEDLTVPVLNPNNISYAFQYMAKLKKLVLQGEWLNVPANNDSMRYCPRLEEVVLPSKVAHPTNSSWSFCSNIPNLKKITLPDEILNPQYLSLSSWLSNSQMLLESILGNCTVAPVVSFFPQVILWYAQLIKNFNHPNLSINSMTWGRAVASMGQKNGELEYLNIDFASSFSGTVSGSNAISIMGNLSSSEIDRIFNALPTISTNLILDMRYNPGWLGCTPSIAQAKGWTVLGA